MSKLKSRSAIATIVVGMATIFLTGCESVHSPGLSLKDAHVVEGPVLIERSGHIYLRYRRALDERGITLAAVLYHKRTKDAAYYFFSVPISHPEWGNLIERPLAYDGTEQLARKGKIFWLDPDGSAHPIRLKKAAPHAFRPPTSPHA